MTSHDSINHNLPTSSTCIVTSTRTESFTVPVYEMRMYESVARGDWTLRSGTRSQWERRRECSTAERRSAPAQTQHTFRWRWSSSGSRSTEREQLLHRGSGGFPSGGTGDRAHWARLSRLSVHRWKLLLFHPPARPPDCNNYSTTCISIRSSEPGPPRWKMRTLNLRLKF